MNHSCSSGRSYRISFSIKILYCAHEENIFFFTQKALKRKSFKNPLESRKNQMFISVRLNPILPIYIQYTYNPFKSWGVVTQVIIIAKLHRVISMLYRIIRTGVDRSPTTVFIIGAREREREREK